MKSSVHEAVQDAEGSTMNASILRMSPLLSSVRQMAPHRRTNSAVRD